jgi:hypothetical protein
MHFCKGRIHKSNNTSHRIAAGPPVIAKNVQLKSTEHAEPNRHENVSNGGVNGDLTWETVTFLDVLYGCLRLFHACMDPLAWKDKTGFHVLDRVSFSTLSAEY